MGLLGALELLEKAMDDLDKTYARERLLKVFLADLYLLGTEGLPDDLAERWKYIRDAMTAKPRRHENDSAYAASVDAMTDGQVFDIVQRIQSLYEEVARREEQESGSR